MIVDRTFHHPIDQTRWCIKGDTTTTLTWDYDDAGGTLLQLYEKSKDKQWNGSARIDWTIDVESENPCNVPDNTIPIFGSKVWERMTLGERIKLRRHSQAYNLSQFLHGEQGALVCAARLVQQLPDLDAKLFAATQVVDEARHVEVFSKLLRDKIELSYPITPPLKALLESIVSDSRWDFTYLGMQVVIEGLALGAFQRLRDYSGNPLIASLTAYVMEDEARHVVFGRTALRDYYRELSCEELAQREDFIVEASFLMRDRFLGEEMWEVVGLPKKECVEISRESTAMRFFRGALFSRIIPIIRYVGLWSEKVQDAYRSMGLLGYANINSDLSLERDERIAAAALRTSDQ